MKFSIRPSLPDNRDFIYQDDGTKITRKYVDLRKWDTIVESQGPLGSCSSNALTNAYELMTNYSFPEHFTHLSRLFIYYNTRFKFGNTEEDEGMYLRDGLKAIAKFGVCSESLWPYVPAQFNVKPTEDCYEDAKKRKIVKYQKLISIYLITQVLNNNIPIVFGMQIYESFMELNKRIFTVNFPSRKEKSLGGHAMCMVGYDLEKNLFLAKNSFGASWGDEGYCWIPFDYIEQEGYDIWTFDIPNPGEKTNVLSKILPILPQEVLL
jgi:C1A family cysteine protease